MPSRRTVLVALLALGSILIEAARAQQIPAAEDGPAIVTSHLVDGQVEMRDAATLTPLLVPRGFTPSAPRPQSECVTPSVELRSQPSGFDLVYTFRNNATFARHPGSLRLGVFTLGDQIALQDFRNDGHEIGADTRQPNPPRAWSYPAYLYSPVAVLKNQSYAIGMSLQYPILEYKHDVALRVTSPSGSAAVGEGGRGWAVEWRLENFGDEPDYFASVLNEHPLGPGEQRVYVLSVRVVKDPADWIRTLLPYRAYFQSVYGPARYQRDPRPIRGCTLAGEWLLSESNPYGFTYPSLRPDLNGWGPWAATLRDMKRIADRVMLWTPTGLFRANPQNNFPFRFASRWSEVAGTNNRMSDAAASLRTVPQAGVELGLWWGRSVEVMSSWDTPRSEPMNPDDPQLVRLAFNELDAAAQTGATMIGLDAFFHSAATPAWTLYRWLEMMQARRPEIRFITEARSCDFMHTLSPTWIDFYPVSSANGPAPEPRVVQSPFFLADFLIPGHETWGGLVFNRLTDALKRNIGQDEIRAEIIRCASLGFVPAVFTDLPFPQASVAAETWSQTVPADIRQTRASVPVPPPPLSLTPLEMMTDDSGPAKASAPAPGPGQQSAPTAPPPSAGAPSGAAISMPPASPAGAAAASPQAPSAPGSAVAAVPSSQNAAPAAAAPQSSSPASAQGGAPGGAPSMPGGVVIASGKKGGAGAKGGGRGGGARSGGGARGGKIASRGGARGSRPVAGRRPNMPHNALAFAIWTSSGSVIIQGRPTMIVPDQGRIMRDFVPSAPPPSRAIAGADPDAAKPAPTDPQP